MAIAVWKGVGGGEIKVDMNMFASKFLVELSFYDGNTINIMKQRQTSNIPLADLS